MYANLSFEETYVSIVYDGGKIISTQQRFYIKGHCLQFCLFIEITKFVSMHPLNLKTKA